jgi:hypothetical protein
MARFTSIVDRYAGDTPRHRDMQWRKAIESDGRFTLEEEISVANPVPTDAAGVVERALSTSFVASLPDEEKQSVVQEIRELVADFGPAFDFPYISQLQAWELTI